MKHAFSMRRVFLLLGLISAAWGLAVPLASAGAQDNPGVLPVHSTPYGRTYGAWSGRFWQWQFSMPVDANPLFDTAPCSAGQSRPVWFLGGTTTQQTLPGGEILGQVTRNCTIPAGTALFFPLNNVECSTLEGNGTTEAELRACAAFFRAFIDSSSLFCVIDGRAVKNLASFLVQSPLFTYGPLPDNNVLEFFGVDAPAGATSPSVSDGYHVMLAPLAVGTHTLHFGGTADYTSVGGPIFIQDITYHITVVPSQ